MAPRYVRLAKRLAKNTLLAFLYALFSILGLWGRLREGGGQRLVPQEVKRILVIRLDLLGDVLLSMPAVRALRQSYPQASIDMLVLPYTAPLLAHYSYFDRIYTFDLNLLRPSGDMWNPAHYLALLRLLHDLRVRRYDLAVTLFGLWGSLIAFLSGARLRVGYRGEGFPLMHNLALPGRRYQERKHEVEYVLALARASGARVEDSRLDLIPLPEAVAKVDRLLAEEGVLPEEGLVAIHPGAKNGSAKRWLPERWGRLADRLASEFGVRIVLTGTAAEEELVARVVSAMRERAVVLAGRTSIPELVALLARCQLVLCGDSAPLHLAVALGVPVVAIHGPTDPLLSGPWGPKATVVRRPLPCSPCYDLRDIADCPRDRPVCMEEITVQEVFEAAQRYLRGEREEVEGRRRWTRTCDQ